MARQALTTGQVTVTGEGVNAVVDFLMPAPHKIVHTGTDLWTDAGSDPIGDLRTWKRLIAQDSGRSADRCILGATAAEAFRVNTAVKAQLDTRRIDMGIIRPEELPDGVTYLGFLNDPGLDLFTYDEWYLDDNDVEQPMVPVDRIIMGSTRADTVRAYGAIQDEDAIQGGMVEAQYYPKSWVTKDPSVRHLLLQSAALVIPKQIDAFVTVKVV